MYIRRAFTVFLDVQSQASFVAPPNDWTLDWRWFCEPLDAVLPSEHSLIWWAASERFWACGDGRVAKRARRQMRPSPKPRW